MCLYVRICLWTREPAFLQTCVFLTEIWVPWFILLTTTGPQLKCKHQGATLMWLQMCDGKRGVGNINHCQLPLDLDLRKNIVSSSASFLHLWGAVKVVSQLETSKCKRKLLKGSLTPFVFSKHVFYTKQGIASWENAGGISRHITQSSQKSKLCSS